MSAEAVSAAKTVTIYALTDPDSGKVRYVGTTAEEGRTDASLNPLSLRLREGAAVSGAHQSD